MDFLFIPIVINSYLLKVTLNSLMKLTKHFDKASKSLKMYVHLFRSIEKNDFESSLLNGLKSKFFNEDKVASKTIGQLGGIIELRLLGIVMRT